MSNFFKKTKRAYEENQYDKIHGQDHNIIPMSGSKKTDAQLVDELSSKNRKMRRLLNNSNSLLRSAYSIAERSGNQTAWIEFKNQVEQELKSQFDFFNEE
jgi:hypothetical protein